MYADSKTKINRLIRQWPRGTAAAVSYLKKNGFSQELLFSYRRNGWLESIGNGAYILAGDTVEWPGRLYALQRHLNNNIHAGGKTALELKGYAHFIPYKQKIFLYGERGKSLPAWFHKNLSEDFEYIKTNLFPDGYGVGLTEFPIRDFTVTISSPERAAMEMLHLVPEDISFDEAYLIIENLAALRAELVQNLLNDCRFVKVKRLFLYMSERQGHQWFSRLDLSNINLGKGKRVIVPGGALDKKYQIVVPRQEGGSTG